MTRAARRPLLGAFSWRQSGDGEGAQRREQDLHYFQAMVLRGSLIVAVVAVCTVISVSLLWRLRVILLLVFVSFFLAALLHPAVSRLERSGLRRGSATAAVYLAATIVAAGLGYILFSPVYDSASRFAAELPTLVQQAQQGKGQIGSLLVRFHVLKYAQQHAPQLESAITKLGSPALAFGRTLLSGVAGLATIAVLTFFILLEAPVMIRGVLAWMEPRRALRLRAIADEVTRTVAGYMLGNLATSLIAGVVVYVALLLTGVPFAAVLAIWVGLVDFLPLIGGLLAGVPTVALAFLHSLPAGIIVLVVFLVYQQIENHLLNPVIMSRTVKLNALFVLLAILTGAELGGLIGSELGGLIGALLAVPTAGAIQVVVRDVWLHRDTGPPEGTSALPETGLVPVNGAAHSGDADHDEEPIRAAGHSPAG